jgi:hypothetical protein
MKVSKCLKCDKDLGFFLFRDKCVRQCPKGTYPDKITGWCAKCDCNCGTGGCIDRFTCKSCPQQGMVIDKETGKCRCNVGVSGAWADDWKSFTITIDSLDIKFRDIKAEQMIDSATNKMKICRIGNEGSMFDNEGKALNVNQIDEVVAKEDLDIDRCGDPENTDGALDEMRQQFENIDHDDREYSDEIPDSTPTNGSPTDSTTANAPSMGGRQGGTSAGSLPQGSAAGDSMPEDSTSGGDQTEGDQNQEKVKTINNKSETCPAKKENPMNNDDLKSAGIDSIDEKGFYKYIKSLGKAFGNISDEELESTDSPTVGLKFTTMPDDICTLLFDQKTLEDIFMKPTCTIMTTATSTKIMVKLGEYAEIHPRFVLKVQPNVFVNGCDWPVLNVIKLTDGANPESLRVRFKEDRNEAMSCQDFSLDFMTEGNVGDLECFVVIDKVMDQDGNQITTEEVGAVMQKAMENGDSGQINISKEDLTILQNQNAKKMRIKGTCKDSYGQEQAVSKIIAISNGETEVKIQNNMEKIAYNPEMVYPLSFNFDYMNCGGTDSVVTHTAVLQKYNSGSTRWEDTTAQNEMIMNNEIPAGLSATERYRVKVTATTPSSTIKEFMLELQFIRKRPEVVASEFSTFVKASDAFVHTFELDDFENVVDQSSLRISFACSKQDRTMCKIRDTTNELDFNSFYTASNLTLSIPENTFEDETTYIITVTAAYQGETGSEEYRIITAPAGVSQALKVRFNIEDGEFIDVSDYGFLKCRPEGTIGEAFTVNSITLVDSSGTSMSLDSTSCVTLIQANEIEYATDCLSSGETYTFSCKITMDSDSTIQGEGSVKFTTDAPIELTATVTPTSGDQLTAFSFTVTNSYTEMVQCILGIEDPQTSSGLIFISDEFIVDASTSATVSDIRIPSVAGATQTTVWVDCESLESSVFGFTSLTVTVTQYAGTDLAEKEQAQTQELQTELDDISGMEDSQITSASAEKMLSKVNTMSTMMNNLEPEKARSTSKKVVKVLKNIDVDTKDKNKVKKLITGLSNAINIAKKGGLDEDTINNLQDVVEKIFGSFEKGNRRLLASSTEAEMVKKLAPKQGDDSVVQLDETNCKLFANTISKMVEGVDSNKGQIKRVTYEKVKKLGMVFIDKLFKS